MSLTKESSLVRLIKKPGGYYTGGGGGTGIGISVGSSISTGEVATSVDNQGALESSLYVRIILIKVND